VTARPVIINLNDDGAGSGPARSSISWLAAPIALQMANPGNGSRKHFLFAPLCQPSPRPPAKSPPRPPSLTSKDLGADSVAAPKAPAWGPNLISRAGPGLIPVWIRP